MDRTADFSLVGKNKEWSSQNPMTAYIYASDGFLLNLNLILLKLARPFAEPYSPKLLKINPLYPISDNEHVHLKGLISSIERRTSSSYTTVSDLHKDTPLIVRDETTAIVTDKTLTFNFITEIFFMAHLSYTCSVHRLHRMLLKVSDNATPPFHSSLPSST